MRFITGKSAENDDEVSESDDAEGTDEVSRSHKKSWRDAKKKVGLLRMSVAEHAGN
jgi:hypothetical protein